MKPLLFTENDIRDGVVQVPLWASNTIKLQEGDIVPLFDEDTQQEYSGIIIDINLNHGIAIIMIERD